MFTKLRQYLCRHKKTLPHKKANKYNFQSLQGVTIYHICVRCGKEIKTEFISNEEYYNNYFSNNGRFWDEL